MSDALLPPSEAAALIGVTTRTLSRWADAVRITVHQTLGGHRRYSRADLLALAAAGDDVERPRLRVLESATMTEAFPSAST